jgi:hypothetical protein
MLSTSYKIVSNILLSRLSPYIDEIIGDQQRDSRLCNNWRGITLLVVTSKIFNKIILEHIMYALENDLRNEQAGFCPNRSCIYQINTLRNITEQSVEFQSPMYMVFVEYKRALDSLNRECIWKELKARGLPSEFLNLIKEGYNRIHHNGYLSEPFLATSAVW